MSNPVTTSIPWADHNLITSELSLWQEAVKADVNSALRAKRSTAKKVQLRNFKSLTTSNFKKHWHSCTRADLTTEDLDAIFHAKLCLIRDILCPLHWVREKPFSHIRNKWFTPELSALRQHGRRLQRLWRKSQTRADHLSYLAHLKLYKDRIKSNKRGFVQSYIAQASNASKALFKISSVLTAAPQTKSFIPKDPLQYCRDTACFFSQKVAKIREKVDTTQASADLPTALQELLKGDVLDSPSKAPSLFEEFSPVSQTEVRRILHKLGPSSSALDPFPTNLMDMLGPEILPDITAIVNNSIKTGSVPSAWKQALVTPLLKKPGQDQGNPQNLRPVSQLRLLPRIVEAIVTSQFQAHCESHSIFHDHQSGFRPGRGTELAVSDIRERLLWHADRSHPSLLVLLDLSAAFDTIDHGILLQRVQAIGGIQGTALEWVRSFLSGRSQAVKWRNIQSEFHPVPWGVPQGSSLSPLLFNLYMRPLADLLEHAGLGFHIYADDTQILVDLHEEAGEKEKLVPCLLLIEEWMRRNKLCLNGAKTELLLVGGRRGDPTQSFPWPPGWGSPPPLNLKVKNLGMVLSHNLDGAAHSAATVRSCHVQLNSLARLCPLLDHKQKIQLFQAAVGSRINYGLTLLTGAPKKQVYAIQKIQNRGIRLIWGLKRRDHLSRWRLRLHWLTITDQLKLKTCINLWRAYYQKGPKFISSWARLPTLNRTRRGGLLHRLAPPRFRKSTRGGRTLASTGARIWNSVPAHIRAMTTLPPFKKALKIYFLQEEAKRLGEVWPIQEASARPSRSTAPQAASPYALVGGPGFPTPPAQPIPPAQTNPPPKGP